MAFSNLSSSKLIHIAVVPSNMNPVGEAGNIFSSLFDRVPAKRAGNEEDIAGSVIYLISRAGVSAVRIGLDTLIFLETSMC